MTTKLEWQGWRDSEITQDLIKLIKVGQEQATIDLIGKRENIADFERGAILYAEEVLDIIKLGDGLYREEEE